MRATRVSQKDGIVVLTPRHDLVGGKESDELQSLIHDFCKRGNQYLIVDLQKVEIVNSAGLRAMEEGLRCFVSQGAQLKVCNATRRITWFVTMFALARRFELYETMPHAIASFESEIDTRFVEA